MEWLDDLAENNYIHANPLKARLVRSAKDYLDIRVEWLCSLSGGVLRFAPFPTCKLAGLVPSL
jgi:hypothetical protein